MKKVTFLAPFLRLKFIERGGGADSLKIVTVQIQIDKLGDSNYLNWQIDTKYLLLEHNTSDIVTEDEKEPEVNIVKGMTVKDIRNFKSRKRLALSTICLTFGKPLKIKMSIYVHAKMC